MSKVMIADDDPGIVDALQMLLTDEGYSVETTVDGRTVHDVKDELPDLILLDIWMSGIDGSEICRYLKHAEATQDIPIIMMSANRDTKTLAMQAGANDYILKPFDIDEVLHKVKRGLAA